MKKFTAKDILTPAIALLVICIAATVLLALTNLLTADTIGKNAVEKENASRTLVLPTAVSFDAARDLVSADGKAMTCCAGYLENGGIAGFVYTVDTKGYGGTVTVMIGLDPNGTVTGIDILSHSETPGLGANSTKPEFKERFIGKSGILTVSKTDNEGQNVQAITAATITSKAVTSAVNAALNDFSRNAVGGAE